MVTGGGPGDTTIGVSGDYCNDYPNIINRPDGKDDSGFSGLYEPSPIANYQEGDSNNNAACQAYSENWGQTIIAVAIPACFSTCGIHHTVSFGSQGEKDFPWASSFVDPSLELSGNFDGATYINYGSIAGAWGYMCALLADTSQQPSPIIEYCLDEWQAPQVARYWGYDTTNCPSPTFGQVITNFGPGTQFETEGTGSTNTILNGASGNHYFVGTISSSDLQAGIFYLNHQPGCISRYSEDPTKYALVGLEHGEEAWRDVSAFGGNESGFTASTIY